MKSSLAGPFKKKVSHDWVAGAIKRSTPLARTNTFFTPSGKRISEGIPTACDRLFVKTVEIDMERFLYMAMTYSNHND
jgi:hypothetical protein